MKTLYPLLSATAVLSLSACQSSGPNNYKDQQVPTAPDTSVNYDRDTPKIFDLMEESGENADLLPES